MIYSFGDSDFIKYITWTFKAESDLNFSGSPLTFKPLRVEEFTLKVPVDSEMILLLLSER